MKNSKRQEAILKIKANLATNLEGAITETLAAMGEDIQGIDWFSSYADKYNEFKERKAA